MSVEIKAIETLYAGHRFRSRLEARWAVFFDAYGIQWMYEPQGYDIGSSRYLPDFWLPEIGSWAEAKGHLDKPGWDRLCEAVWNLPAKPEGLPFSARKDITPSIVLLGSITSVAEAAQGVHHVLGWGLDEDRNLITTYWAASFIGPNVLMPVGFQHRADRVVNPNPLLESACHDMLSPNETLAAAYDRARKARFEFGEQG